MNSRPSWIDGLWQAGWRSWALMLGVMAVVIASSSYTFVQVRILIRQQAEQTLALSAEYQRQAIEHHLAETQAEIAALSTGAAQLPEHLARWLDQGQTDSSLAAWMQERLQEMIQTRGWGGARVLDIAGHELFHEGSLGLIPAPEQLEAVRQGAGGQFIDLVQDAQGEWIYGYLSPIRFRDGPIIGVFQVTLRRDRSLLPLLQSWPRISKTAESLLIRGGDGRCEHLTPPRDPAHPLSIELAHTASPCPLTCVKALFGPQGLIEGSCDPLGQPVIAYGTPIAQTPWILIAKIDEAEALAPVDALFWVVILVTGVILGLVVSLGLLLWQRAQEGRIAEAIQAQRISEGRLQTLIELLPVGVALVEAGAGRICEANAILAKILGYPLEDLLGRTWIELSHPEDRAQHREQIARLLAGEITSLRLEKRCLRADGSSVWLSVTGSRLEDPQHESPYLLCLIEDISERREREAELIAAREAAARFASEQRLGAIVNQGLMGVSEIDAEGRIVRVNARYAEILGYPPETLIGRPLRDLVIEDEWPKIAALLERLRQGDPPETIERRFRRPDGELGYLSVSATALRGPDGEYRGAIALVADITEQRRTQEGLLLAIESAQLGLWNWDLLTDRIRGWGHFHEQFGLSPGAEPGYAELLEYLHPEDRPSIEQQVSGLLVQGSELQLEYRVRRLDDGWRWLSVRGRAYRNPQGAVERMSGVTLDITERKLLEMALRDSERRFRELNAHLERQVAERTAEARAASAAKSEFLAHMSHEIRTPLNAVLGLAQLLARDPLTPEQGTLVKHIQEAGDALLAILDDILDLSKIEAGRLRLEQRPFTLNQLLSKIDSLMLPNAQARGLVLRIDTPAKPIGALLGDPLRLDQVLLNLVSNAIKFTDQGMVWVRIRVIAADSQRLRLRFEVEDTGIGIEPHLLPRLFQPFSQLDEGTNRRYGGTGLGLAISKHLVELMGGIIGVESTPGRGSRFWFEVPLARVPETLPAKTSPQPPPANALRLAGRHFLVVDDSTINREVVERFLKKEGAEVIAAADGQQAIQTLSLRPAFDAVLMDIRMPVMDGLTAASKIREELGLRDLPIIALTAGVMAEEQAAIRAAGFNDFLAKPIDLEQLITCLQRWVESRPPIAQATAQAAVEVQSPDTGIFPELPGFNPAQAAQSLNGDPLLFGRLLGRLLDDYLDLPDQVRRSMQIGAHESARQRLHRLRGEAGNLGLTELIRLAEHLELALAQQGVSESSLQSELNQLAASLEALAAAARPWIVHQAASAQAEAKEPVPREIRLPLPAPDPEQIAALRQALADHKAQARWIFAALAPALRDHLAPALYRRLENAIRNLSFDEALGCLDGPDPAASQSAEKGA